MGINEELDHFFSIAEHADEFVITKNGQIFKGILDKEYVETNEIQGYQPLIICKTDDLNELSRGDKIERGKEVYTYILQEVDGTGLSRVIMELYSA